MIAFFRLIVIVLYVAVVSILGCLCCLFRPFHHGNAQIFAILYAKVAILLGVKVIHRIHPDAKSAGPCVIIANHQNSYDIFTISGALPKNGVTIGKKSLKWIPFFGQIYWLSGNILIDRNNRKSAHSTLTQATNAIKNENVTVWMFPEGTRSYGKGLLKFKRGAFQLAAEADVPIMPIVMNTTHEKIKLNRWNNGTVIIETLAPKRLNDEDKADLRTLGNDYHALMKAKITALDKEVADLEQAK